MVPAAPGGAMTEIALALDSSFNENGVQSVVLYNPGANGDIAIREALKMRDNVILDTARGLAVFSNVTSDRENPYTKNFVFVAPIVGFTMGFESTSKNFNSLKEMVEYAKQNPLPCGAAGPHGSFELLRINKKYGTQFEPIIYKGSSQLRLDLIEGTLKCAYDGVPSNVQLHETGKLKILSTDKYVKGIDVPLTNTVLHGYTFENWLGFAIPKDSNLLKNPQVMKVIRELNNSKNLEALVNTPGFVKSEPDSSIDKIMDQDIEMYRKLKK